MAPAVPISAPLAFFTPSTAISNSAPNGPFHVPFRPVGFFCGKLCAMASFHESRRSACFLTSARAAISCSETASRAFNSALRLKRASMICFLFMSRPLEGCDIAGASIGNGRNVFGPSQQCAGLFCFIGAAIVDPGDTRSCAADVIENCFNDVRADANLGHAGGAAPAQIVNAPRADLHAIVEALFGSAPTRKALCACAEDKGASLLRSRL